jgi:hypothetical protein
LSYYHNIGISLLVKCLTNLTGTNLGVGVVTGVKLPYGVFWEVKLGNWLASILCRWMVFLTLNRLCDPPRVLFREFWVGGGIIPPGVNIPELVIYDSAVYCVIEYMENFLKYPVRLSGMLLVAEDKSYCPSRNKIFPSNSGARTSLGYGIVV